MSLRFRFTLLYSLLAGGILLIFGTAVYFLVSILLVNQVDDTLSQTSQEIIANTRIDSVGELDVIILPRYNFTSNLLVQVWDSTGNLHSSSESIADFTQPLDGEGLLADLPVYRNVTIQSVPLRTLSVPLYVSDRSIGTLQIAMSMELINTIRNTLFYILLGTTFISMFLAGFSSWFVIGQALAPLEVVTETALQITHADDLSRRIPYKGSEKDEIGQLIFSFNETLERLDKLFSSQQRFLADVSHELRTPLTVIKANVDLMRRMDALDLESMHSIEEEADRLTRLVGDLLLLAQVESGKLPLTVQPVDLDSILLVVIKELHSLADGRVQIKIPEIDQVQVSGDPDRLKQVLVNLISNAIKYTPGDGKVTCTLKRSDGHCLLTIADDGPGIPAEDLPHIFERFYRAEKSRTRSKTTGYGLGLSIAYWIISNHNGKIDVRSKEGFGTTFIISLPILKETSLPH